jgi:dienelactone hydrolase
MSTKTMFIGLGALGLAFVFSSSVQAATYYVEQGHPRANDNNAGTEALPWKTINHAATILQPGDTVLVKEGTYNVGASPGWATPAVNPSRSGTKDSPITFKSYQCHKVTITTSGGQAAIGSSNQDYIVWDGFIVDMANRPKGIIIYDAKGCVIKYCEVIGNYIPTGDNHDGIRIEKAPDCWIHHNIIHGIKGDSVNSAGIKVYSKGEKNVIIEDNYVYDNTAGVFDKDFGVQNTYRRNYFTRNTTQFYGNNQGGPAVYHIYDNVFDGDIELHAGNTGTEVHDNLVRSGKLIGAWAGGVADTKIWNNIVISKGSSIMACQIKKQQLHSALAYMDYNVYDADPTYDFGEYTSNHRRLSLAQMQSTGLEKNSYVVPSVKDIFEDEKSYQLLPKWKTAGRYKDAVGPEDSALVLDLSRYGPLASPPAKSPSRQDENSSIKGIPEEIAPFFRPPPELANDFGNYKSPLKFYDGTAVNTPVDWQRRRQEIISTWHNIMGSWPPLIEKPKIEYIAREQREDFTQHQVRIEIAPGQQTVDGYLLVPDGKGIFAAVLVVYYDAQTGVGLGKELRDFGYQLTKRGFITLSIGTPAFCSLRPPYKPLYQSADDRAHLQPLSALAYVAANCYNALASLSDVDPNRIGIIGHSYGGKWAMFASCLYEKFACAVWSDPGIVFDETRANVNYWEPWYLGYESDRQRASGIPGETNPRIGAYKVLFDKGHDLHELHSLMAPRSFLVSGGSEDPPERWKALNHSIAVNSLLGYTNRVAMTNRKEHSPTAESNEQIYLFLKHFLKSGKNEK